MESLSEAIAVTNSPSHDERIADLPRDDDRREVRQGETLALMYTPHGDNVLLVASLGGSSKNPVWYHNLKKKPEIEIQAGSKNRKMRAREAGPEEREKLWPVVVASYAPFAEYQTRTTRQIPIFVCEPR